MKTRATTFARFRLVALIALTALSVSLVLRLLLLVAGEGDHGVGVAATLTVLARGAFYDLVATSYAVIPFVLYHAAAPDALVRRRWHGWVAAGVLAASVFVIVFSAVAEWLFWDEFQVRFNFIAVDYLVYTHEVVGNIRESYPLPGILLAVAAAAAATTFWLWRRGGANGGFAVPTAGWRRRWAAAGLLLVAPLLSWGFVDETTWPPPANAYDRELSSNGLYSLVRAFRTNELDYAGFYPMVDEDLAWGRVRSALGKKALGLVESEPEREAERKGTGRTAGSTAPRRNVILVAIESLSARYLGCMGHPRNLTPELDRLAREGLFFRRCFATGTRTVRGMEALTLSVPPTPGRSIVKREHNEGLRTIGRILRDHGYDAVFLYGGNGYFDNMNHYFGHNGFRVVDGAGKPDSAVTFSTIWGACDEDLYDWTLAEADRAHEEGRPFFHFVMTVSNHRPYEFPTGRVDLAPGSRGSAIRYTSFAVGELIRKARSHAWFDDTIFVLVADHCANSAGRTSVPVSRYHIPLILHAPKIVEPRVDDRIVSQVDVAPTLLGLLGVDGATSFFGRDLLAPNCGEGRAFLATYQKLGYLKGGRLAVLAPRTAVETFRVDFESLTQAPIDEDERLTEEAISFYEVAWLLWTRHRGHPEQGS